jgi:hypothetical protein
VLGAGDDGHVRSRIPGGRRGWFIDDRRVVVASDEDPCLEVWDLEGPHDGERLLPAARLGAVDASPCDLRSFAFCMAVRPDGAMLAMSTGHGLFLRPLVAESHPTQRAHACPVSALAWARDGRLVTGTRSGCLVWDVDGRRVQAPGPPGEVCALAVTDDVLAWSTPTAIELAALGTPFPTRADEDGRGDAPGRLLASGGGGVYTTMRGGRLLRVVPSEAGTRERPIGERVSRRPVLALAVGRDVVVLGGGGHPPAPAATRYDDDAGEIAIVDSTTGVVLERRTRRAPVTALAMTGDGTLVAGLADGCLDVTPAGKSLPRAVVSAHESAVVTVALLEEGALVAELSGSGAVGLRDARDLRDVLCVPLFERATAIAASRDGRRLAIGLETGEVVVVDVAIGP